MFSAMRRFKQLFAILTLGFAVSFVTVDYAEARRGGGFGSRGTRTFQAPPATRTAPAQPAPIDRSMTPRTQTNQQNAAPRNATQQQAGAQRNGFFGGGFGRSMLGGLLMGGLLGMLLGQGFGGGFGFLGMLLQIALIAGAVMLAMRFFAQRRQPAYSAAGSSERSAHAPPSGQGMPSFQIPKIGSLAGGSPAGGSLAGAAAPKPVESHDEIGITQDDLDAFERTLNEVQAAYAAEDYAALRRLSTPEAMSFLAEELSDNATSGVKNDVSDVRLLQGDVAEAWRENELEYATVAMMYSSIDVMRDRATGRVISGDETVPTEAVEMWTFVRKAGADWQVSAIQSVEDGA